MNEVEQVSNGAAERSEPVAEVPPESLPESLPESTDAQLSRLLFEARTAVELLGDRLRSHTGEKDRWSGRLIGEIDDYRARRGWSADGFGGE